MSIIFEHSEEACHKDVDFAMIVSQDNPVHIDYKEKDFIGDDYYTKPEIDILVKDFKTAEQIRNENELRRIQFELNREYDEDFRQANEIVRIENEDIRIENEKNRQSTFETLESQATELIDRGTIVINEAEDATDSANEAAEYAIQKANEAVSKWQLCGDEPDLPVELWFDCSDDAASLDIYAVEAIGKQAKIDGDYARVQGDYAKEQGDKVAGLTQDVEGSVKVVAELIDISIETLTDANAAAEGARQSSVEALESANMAKQEAERAANSAESALFSANVAMENSQSAQIAATAANISAQAAESAASNAISAANQANTQATFAQTQGQFSLQSGKFAEEAGAYAQQKAEEITGFVNQTTVPADETVLWYDESEEMDPIHEIGDILLLETENKDNVVSAINEVNTIANRKADLYNFQKYSNGIMAGYWGSNGSFYSNSLYNAIQIKSNTIKSIVITTGNSASAERVILLENNNIISNTSYTQCKNFIINIPENIDEIRFSTTVDNISKFMVSYGVLYGNSVQNQFGDKKDSSISQYAFTQNVGVNSYMSNINAVVGGSGVKFTDYGGEQIVNLKNISVIYMCKDIVNAPSIELLNIVRDSQNYFKVHRYGWQIDIRCVLNGISYFGIINTASGGGSGFVVINIDFENKNLEIFRNSVKQLTSQVLFPDHQVLQECLLGSTVSMMDQSATWLVFASVMNRMLTVQEITKIYDNGNVFRNTIPSILRSVPKSSSTPIKTSSMSTIGGGKILSYDQDSVDVQFDTSGSNLYIANGSDKIPATVGTRQFEITLEIEIISGDMTFSGVLINGRGKPVVTNFETGEVLTTNGNVFLEIGRYKMVWDGIGNNISSADLYLINFSISSACRFIMSNYKYREIGEIIGVNAKSIANGVLSTGKHAYEYSTPTFIYDEFFRSIVFGETNTAREYDGQMLINQNNDVYISAGFTWKKITP